MALARDHWIRGLLHNPMPQKRMSQDKFANLFQRLRFMLCNNDVHSTAKCIPSFLPTLFLPTVECLSTVKPHQCPPNIWNGHIIGQCFPPCRLVRSAVLSLFENSSVLQRGCTPVVVGGTGFYLKWYVHGKADTPATDPEASQRAKDTLDNVGAAKELRFSLSKQSQVLVPVVVDSLTQL